MLWMVYDKNCSLRRPTAQQQCTHLPSDLIFFGGFPGCQLFCCFGVATSGLPLACHWPEAWCVSEAASMHVGWSILARPPRRWEAVQILRKIDGGTHCPWPKMAGNSPWNNGHTEALRLRYLRCRSRLLIRNLWSHIGECCRLDPWLRVACLMQASN